MQKFYYFVRKYRKATWILVCFWLLSQNFEVPLEILTILAPFYLANHGRITVPKLWTKASKPPWWIKRAFGVTQGRINCGDILTKRHLLWVQAGSSTVDIVNSVNFTSPISWWQICLAPAIPARTPSSENALSHQSLSLSEILNNCPYFLQKHRNFCQRNQQRSYPNLYNQKSKGTPQNYCRSKISKTAKAYVAPRKHCQYQFDHSPALACIKRAKYPKASSKSTPYRWITKTSGTIAILKKLRASARKQPYVFWIGLKLPLPFTPVSSGNLTKYSTEIIY